MNQGQAMDMWPEFVTDEPGGESERHGNVRVSLTGWETVVFELTDDQDDGLSAFSTASLAP